MHLSKIAILVADEVWQNERINTADFARANGISRRIVQYSLQRLEQEGAVRCDARSRKGIRCVEIIPTSWVWTAIAQGRGVQS